MVLDDGAVARAQQGRPVVQRAHEVVAAVEIEALVGLIEEPLEVRHGVVGVDRDVVVQRLDVILPRVEEADEPRAQLADRVARRALLIMAEQPALTLGQPVCVGTSRERLDQPARGELPQRRHVLDIACHDLVDPGIEGSQERQPLQDGRLARRPQDAGDLFRRKHLGDELSEAGRDAHGPIFLSLA